MVSFGYKYASLFLVAFSLVGASLGNSSSQADHQQQPEEFCARTETQKDKALGSFIASAIADAIGTKTEHKIRDSYVHVTGMADDNNVWTDDTAIALNLAETLIELGGRFDSIRFMEKNFQWLFHGYNSHPKMMNQDGVARCCGATIWSAIEAFNRSREAYMKTNADEKSKSNGCLMRDAAASVMCYDDLNQAIKVSDAHVGCTHSNPYVVEINRLFNRMKIAGINCDQGRDVVIARMLMEVDTFETSLPELENFKKQVKWMSGLSSEELLGLRLKKDSSRVINSWNKESLVLNSGGHAGDSLFCAIWALLSGQDFKETILHAVNLGHDADTVGAITGQLAGAVYGASAIPEGWKEKLVRCDDIKKMAEDLAIGKVLPIDPAAKDPNKKSNTFTGWTFRGKVGFGGFVSAIVVAAGAGVGYAYKKYKSKKKKANKKS
jgi:ADP-ribosylglycohydrolase